MTLSRITDSMMNYGFMSGMNKSLNTQYKLMEQTSDGKRIHRPSDDPIRVIRSLQYSTAIVQNEQFSANVKDATSWMEITDQAVGDLSEIMSQAKSLVVRAIAPSADITYEAAATQLDGLINEAVSIANTKIGDRYVFGGQMDSTQPFERVQLADPKGLSNLTVDTVVYYGDDKKISMVTQAGGINTARDGINLTGVDLFGRSASTGTQYGQATTDVFNQLIRIKEELQKKSTVTATNSLSGELQVDGGYTGPNTYQDFAVKIDALRIHLNNYTQSNAGGGSLALSWTGEKSAMPAYPTNLLQMRIDALKVTPTVTSPVAHATGSVTMDSTSNTMPVLPASGLQLRVHSVQVETGVASQSNALGGALSVTYNGYGDGTAATATIPDNLQVRITGVSAVPGSIGEVTGAQYSTDGTNWYTATVGAGGALSFNDTTTLPGPGNNIGMTATIATDTDNAANNTYTIPLTDTGKVMKLDYTVDNWATTNVAAPNTATNPLKFTLTAAATGFAGNTDVQIGTVATNAVGDIHTVTAMTTSGEVAKASYSTDGGGTWAAADPDTASGVGSFILGTTGFKSRITANASNAGTQTYTLGDLEIDAASEASEMSYSLDKGNTWIKATAPAVTKSLATSGDLTLGGKYTGLPAYQDIKATVAAWKTSATFTQSNVGGGVIQIAADGAAAAPAVPATFQTRIDTVDTSGKVTALSYSLDSGATWTSGTAQASQGPSVFSLGASGLYATVATDSGNAAGDTYSTTGGTSLVGDPALISYTSAPAPGASGTMTPSAPVYSMKDANPSVAGFALPDGVTADIESNANNALGTTSYTFRLPPNFTLQDGVEVNLAPNTNNQVKDAFTFHMPQSSGEPDHTDANAAVGPDLDWLTDKGLADLDSIHDQILTALVDIGTKASMYEMTGNMLESSYTNLSAVLASNEDLDMAKAIIDMKTAENTYKAALSFGSRIMPTSLVDFLR